MKPLAQFLVLWWWRLKALVLRRTFVWIQNGRRVQFRWLVARNDAEGVLTLDRPLIDADGTWHYTVEREP